MLTLGHWVLQNSFLQLTTKTSEWGLLGAWHTHVSHRLEEITAPGWEESGLGISGLKLRRYLLCTLTGQLLWLPTKLTHSLGNDL